MCKILSMTLLSCEISTTVPRFEHSLLLPFLGTWMKVKVKVKVTQSCPTLGNPMDYIDHGILQARILEWVAFPFSRGSSQPRDWTQVSCIAGRFCTSWATRGDQGSVSGLGRSPGEGNGYPFQYSSLKNSMDRRIWWLQATGSKNVRHNWMF